VRSNEIFPSRFLTALGRWRQLVPLKDVTHGLVGDEMTEIGQSSNNAILSPTGVLPGEADNQCLQFGFDCGAAG
jgi:hypothetical protein